MSERLLSECAHTVKSSPSDTSSPRRHLKMDDSAAERSSPFVFIDATWLLRVRSAASAVEVTLTDLCSHYVGRCDASSVCQQVEQWGAAEPAPILQLLHECVDIPTSEKTKHCAFRVLRREASALVEWSVRGETCLAFHCSPSTEPAVRLRDEVILPLMRAAEQLRRLVPAGAWQPDAPSGELPLPQLTEPPLRAMLEHASGASGSTSALPLEGSGEGSAAEPSRSCEPPAHEQEASASHAASDEEQRRQQQEQQQRKRTAAALAREQAAKKAKLKVASHP